MLSAFTLPQPFEGWTNCATLTVAPTARGIAATARGIAAAGAAHAVLLTSSAPPTRASPGNGDGGL